MNSQNHSQKAKGRILIICTALLYGLAGVCVKSISWNAMSIIAVRSAVSLIMLLAVRKFTRLAPQEEEKKNFRSFFSGVNLAGALFMCATGILYVLGIKHTTAGTAIVLQYIAPILVFLFTVLFRGRRASVPEILITIAVFAGIVLSFAGSLDFTHIFGNAISLASGFTYAGQIIMMSDRRCDTFACTMLGNAMSLIVCIPFLLTDHLVFDFQNLFWLGILAVFQYGLANLTFAKGVQLIDSVEVSLLLTIEPIFNPIPVAIICGEHMDTLSIIGSAIVILAVALYGLLPRLTGYSSMSSLK